MLGRITAEELLAMFGLRHELVPSVALADSLETLALATFLVGRSRYLG